MNTYWLKLDTNKGIQITKPKMTLCILKIGIGTLYKKGVPIRDKFS